MKTIEIWQPRYSTKSVLVATHKIAIGVNYITFTKDKSLFGNIYKIDGNKARTYPKQPNGSIEVYEIPMSELELIVKN
jgi:hypothetical protein